MGDGLFSLKLLKAGVERKIKNAVVKKFRDLKDTKEIMVV